MSSPEETIAVLNAKIESLNIALAVSYLAFVIVIAICALVHLSDKIRCNDCCYCVKKTVRRKFPGKNRNKKRLFSNYKDDCFLNSADEEDYELFVSPSSSRFTDTVSFSNQRENDYVDEGTDRAVILHTMEEKIQAAH